MADKNVFGERSLLTKDISVTCIDVDTYTKNQGRNQIYKSYHFVSLKSNS